MKQRHFESIAASEFLQGFDLTSQAISRRSFIKVASLFVFAQHLPITFAATSSINTDIVEVTLEGRAPDLGNEIVNFGLPLPRNFLLNADRVRVLSSTGKEIPAAIRSLEPWRTHGKKHGIRSLLIQFNLDFTEQKTHRIKVTFDQMRQKHLRRFVPVVDTLIERDGLKGPRVMALLPADWLCVSQIVGPQIPTSASDPYGAYDRFVEKNFPGSLKYLKSQIYHEWLFDRTSVYYKMYVRSGQRKFLEAAYEAAHFLRLHTKMEDPDAGIFTLKGADLKYVYPRAMHIHYLLTGDERALSAGKLMAEYCLKNQDPVYRPELISPTALGTDPERNRRFWSLRHQGYGLLGILHGWEMTGERKYWTKARECVDAYYKHQRQPPDGRPPDGSLRQDWELYDPNEATYKGATSAWMMALLLDPLFQYWGLTNDPHVPEIVVKWCDFLDRQGMLPDGSKAYYVINCLATVEPRGEVGPDMEMHNPELAYTFALGMFFTKDRKRQQIFRERFQRLFTSALTLDVNRPARAFNWAFQFSSQLIYFMKHVGKGVDSTSPA